MHFPGKFVLSLLPVALLACTRMDVSSQNYKSHAEASDAGALGKGMWLPGGLPKNAVDIREAHDVDTNEVWFSYSDTSNETPSECSEIAWVGVLAPRVRRVTEIDEFSRNVRSLQRSGRGHLYRCRGEEYDYYLAVDPRSNQAFGWSLGDTGDRKSQ